jgi:hypothetical protein
MDHMENLSHTGRGHVVFYFQLPRRAVLRTTGRGLLEAWQSRKRAGSKGNGMWDQVHIVIAIPTRYAVFAGDNISGCGYWVSTSGGDEAVIRDWIRWQAKRPAPGPNQPWATRTAKARDEMRLGPPRAGILNERGNCARNEFLPYKGRKRASAHCRSAVIEFEIGSSRGCASTGPSSAPADGGQRNPVKS